VPADPQSRIASLEAEVAKMRPVYLAAMHWYESNGVEHDLATMRLIRVCREAKAKEPNHDE
jgi:hypothetical protein